MLAIKDSRLVANLLLVLMVVFLKGYYGGHLLAAMGQDANNVIFVIAYAIVNAEDEDN